MPEPPRNAFQYALVRVLPRVERGECLNVGVVLLCRPRRYLGARISLDERRLAALGVGVAGQDEPLGYRGFSVRGRAAPVRVFRGQVMNGRRALADPGRGLERWLLDSGRGSIDPGLAAYVDSEIASGP